MVERIRNLDPGVEIFPGRTDFVVVLANVLIAAIHSEFVADSSACHRNFEATVGRDREIGHHPAITPAADTELVWIRDATGNRVVDGGEHVQKFLLAPI